ncbi:TetR/AcrR family transcriptional regulator [Acinetobacter rudis]|uniref:TetR/AcrR family transcriptional regulator n=1 Tax=Acinetobacter rudis TaxID=632955 RepID=A0AAW8JEQ4_9GAMM|nr:TetR/AcrR family transcriptional regulator [Acinetobacter rudis]MDQ8936144.1 TetR/AcrR family transcriptional regulator [Acinetobacter rudis]MDQ8954288.1 TetR/AcrR family transcriptional regulator [Acinetobacter rudis]MDQ9018407.1 TetR/AcrR family transcriptional regulator [Acinetobacter rudis]
MSPSTFDKICVVATTHFATHGYDASSLNTIAEEVGIRKASLYNHFKSKNDLFATVFVSAYQQEQVFMQQCFDAQPKQYLGGDYCASLPARFSQAQSLALFLKASFMGPDFLQTEIKAAYSDYLTEIGRYFMLQLKTTFPYLSLEQASTLHEAYLGIIDSLHIELIYSTLDAYEKKRTAMLEVLTWAIQASTHAYDQS